MRDQLTGSGNAHLRHAADPWVDFRNSLTLLLRREDATGALEFSAPSQPSGGQSRCTVQLAGGASQAWVTASRAPLPLITEMVEHTAPTDPERIARAIVQTCRDRLDVPHPQVLTLHCEGAIGRHTGALRLIRTDCVPPGRDPADRLGPSAAAVDITDRADARERFETVVEQVTGRRCATDADGDLAFDHAGHRMHIDFEMDDPGVVPHARIWAWVVLRVRSRPDAALEAARLNGEDALTTWVLDGHNLLQRTTVPLAPFNPAHARDSLEHFLHTYAATRGAIASRLRPR